ncbi:hypothetical protein T069G_00545 [Trichoderma breve]|uniref:Uncharacterized protein n=1 Tax=Trichoderma breve TaxID=2034170 RepID=A0A9W9JQR7_9HYPO|nr:hypothetical protein T069G_00545 [Trichoderma breve]KAJ4864015.1 hypothetical protein T069G_00545 [Trichoderma breve]
MSDINPNTKKFYIAIACSILGLFLLLIVPCVVAMCVVRYREKRQERRDALARELEEGQGDDNAAPKQGTGPDNAPLYQEATLLHHADGHVEVRKPEPTKGKGIASPQARPVGRFQEDLPEASEQQLQTKQDDAVAESQGSQKSVDSKKKRLDLDE